MKPVLKWTVLLLWIATGCQTPGALPGHDAGPPMSYENARGVVLAMQRIPMAPPPRKLDDIRDLLDPGAGTTTVYMQNILQSAEMPDTTLPSADTRYHFYKSRGNARFELSRFNEAAADFRSAIDAGAEIGVADSALYLRLAEVEMYAGRYDAAMDLSDQALAMLEGRGFRIGPYLGFQARVLQRMGHFGRAGYAIRRAYSYYKKLPANIRLSLIVDAGQMDIGNEIDIITAEAELQEAQGFYEGAYALRAQVLNYAAHLRRNRPRAAVFAETAMAENLLQQRRLVAAEIEARWAVKHAVAAFGRQSPTTAAAAQTLGEVLLARGDTDNAGLLSDTQTGILEELAMPADEEAMIRARLFRGAVYCAVEDFRQAVADFDEALAGMRQNRYLFHRLALRNADLMLALVETGRREEAASFITRNRSETGSLGDDASRDGAVFTAIEALLRLHQGQPVEAGELFAAAAPGLTAIVQDPASTFQQRHRADYLLRAYTELLMDRHAAGDRGALDILFRLADVGGGRVEAAMGQSAARAASLVDPTLTELVRQEQDADQKITSLKATYFNAVAAGVTGLADMETAIHDLGKARDALRARIETEFPKYNGYVKPTPPGMADIRAVLAPSEAFIVIWSLPEKSLVWAIPASGEPVFNVVSQGAADCRKAVTRLKQALRPNVRTLSDIPDFDVDTAHGLYRDFLAPVAPGWRGATHLLAVIRSPLDEIPLALLPTRSLPVAADHGLMFEGYRSVPWLIRDVAITRLPSSAALVTLRALTDPVGNREAFAGFGDPVFNTSQVEIGDGANSPLARRGGNIAIRGIRVSESGRLDSDAVTSVTIENLNRLPDTAAEITEIAANLGAVPDRDVFLGPAASETAVKTADLSKKRVLAFATHALLPGDLNGLSQPALAFSSPSVTALPEDGLLTVGEILTLHLNADLVVLSACDTGAADGSGQEAMSGLGRAFFYAGARAMLVSMWPVETTSAKKLTTGLFRYKTNYASATWAEAQQASIRALLDNGGMTDAGGKVVASYAHPLFWGPFVLVGDGGVR